MEREGHYYHVQSGTGSCRVNGIPHPTQWCCEICREWVCVTHRKRHDAQTHPPSPPEPHFVAIKSAVMRGAEHVATAISKTMAKRIANALNKHRPNSEGV